jgi:tetratricopeptide (TPR) repeat protein
MNLWLPFLSKWLSALSTSVVVFGCLGLLMFWILADLLYSIRLMKDSTAFLAKGKASDSARVTMAALFTRRPFAWLFHRLVIPGALEAQLALTLSMAGRNEEGLPWAERAIRRAAGRPYLLAACLSAHAHVLSNLGRYSEAQTSIDRLRALPGIPPHLGSVAGLNQFHQGHLDAALDIARDILARNPREDGSRGLMSQSLSLKGDLAGAIEALLYEPKPGQILQPLRSPVSGPAGAEAAEIHRSLERMQAAVVKPGRWLNAADIYLCHEDVGGAEFALERARTLLDGNPVVEMMYHRVRARMLARKGQAADAAGEIAKARELLAAVPRRSSSFETDQAEGECMLSAGRASEAVALFEKAGRQALHPIEKHQNAYWQGKAFEASGRPADAVVHYRNVLASQIGGRHARLAEEALARLGASLP